MRIATYNINGIKARLETLSDWLRNEQPDIAILQEIKSTDETFPAEAFDGLGYNLVTHGQKSFNGLAIFSKFPIEDVQKGLLGDEADEQARWLEATISGIRVCGLYLPNGNPAPGPKYEYKLNWMKRLKTRAEALIKSEEIAFMAGDYNIIPQKEDAATPEAWRDDALFRQESRDAFQEIVNLGFTEAFRTLHPNQIAYSFWDYQAGAWQKNNGIRIDHFLLTPQAADRLKDCWIEADARGKEKPSDHVPVWIELEL